MSLGAAITKRIRQRGQPWVFTPKDFLDLGTPHAVGMTLLRLVRRGHIRRLARGLYDCPKTHPVLGQLSPAPEAIAEALAGRDGTRIQASGAYAANLLHLSEQVPAKAVYHTDGASRSVRVGRQTILLKHAAPGRLRAHDRMSALVIQAFRYLGKEHVRWSSFGTHTSSAPRQWGVSMASIRRNSGAKPWSKSAAALGLRPGPFSFGAVWNDGVRPCPPSGRRGSGPASECRKRVCFLRLFLETFLPPQKCPSPFRSLVGRSVRPLARPRSSVGGAGTK